MDSAKAKRKQHPHQPVWEFVRDESLAESITRLQGLDKFYQGRVQAVKALDFRQDADGKHRFMLRVRDVMSGDSTVHLEELSDGCTRFYQAGEASDGCFRVTGIIALYLSAVIGAILAAGGAAICVVTAGLTALLVWYAWSVSVKTAARAQGKLLQDALNEKHAEPSMKSPEAYTGMTLKTPLENFSAKLTPAFTIYFEFVIEQSLANCTKRLAGMPNYSRLPGAGFLPLKVIDWTDHYTHFRFVQPGKYGKHIDGELVALNEGRTRFRGYVPTETLFFAGCAWPFTGLIVLPLILGALAVIVSFLMPLVPALTVILTILGAWAIGRSEIDEARAFIVHICHALKQEEK